jgi:hypothetical protein
MSGALVADDTVTTHRKRRVATVSQMKYGCFVLSLIVLVAMNVAGCGDGGAGNTVATVGHRSITAAQVKHWMSVIAGETTLLPGQPVPRSPEPPRYSACVAYRQRFPANPEAKQPRLSLSELKHECMVEFQKEKLKALYFLISYDWVNGEAAELGIRPTDQEVVHELEHLKIRFPGPTLRHFLVGYRGSRLDMLMRIKLTLLTARVKQKVEGENAKRHLTTQQRQQALDRFSRRFATNWSGRTSCQPDYVVPACRQYKPPRTAPTLVPPSIPLTDIAAE